MLVNGLMDHPLTANLVGPGNHSLPLHFGCMCEWPTATNHFLPFLLNARTDLAMFNKFIGTSQWPSVEPYMAATRESRRRSDLADRPSETSSQTLVDSLHQVSLLAPLHLPPFRFARNITEAYLRNSCSEDEMALVWPNRSATLLKWADAAKLWDCEDEW